MCGFDSTMFCLSCFRSALGVFIPFFLVIALLLFGLAFWAEHKERKENYKKQVSGAYPESAAYKILEEGETF